MSEAIALHSDRNDGRRLSWGFLVLLSLQIAIVVVLFTLPNPIITSGVLLTLLFGAVILVDPRSIVLIITFITFTFHADVIGTEYIVRILGVNWYAMDWIVFFSLLTWLTRQAFGASSPIPKTFLTIPLIIFLISLPLFAAYSVSQGNRFQDAFADLRLLFYYISYFAVLYYSRDWKDFEILFWTMIVCGTIGAVPNIVQSLAGSSFDSLSGRTILFRRITGAHEVNYPLLLAASMSMLPFIQTWGKRLLAILAILVSTIALYLSYTRGSWLAVLIGGAATIVLVLVYANLSRRHYARIIGTIGTLLTTVLSFVVLGILDFRTLVTRASMVSTASIDISSLQRITEWQTAIQIFLDHPLFGGGLGYIYRFSALGVGQLRQIFLHNSYLFVLSKMGLIGFLLFIFLYGAFLWRITRILKKVSNPCEIGLVVAFSSMILVLMVKALTTWYLNTLTTSLFLGVILGALGAMDAKTMTSTPRTPSQKK